MKRGLKRFLPIVLERGQAILGAATCVAHPAECLREKITNVADPVIIQAIDHTLDHGAGFIGLGHIRIACQHGLFGA